MKPMPSQSTVLASSSRSVCFGIDYVICSCEMLPPKLKQFPQNNIQNTHHPKNNPTSPASQKQPRFPFFFYFRRPKTPAKQNQPQKAGEKTIQPAKQNQTTAKSVTWLASQIRHLNEQNNQPGPLPMIRRFSCMLQPLPCLAVEMPIKIFFPRENKAGAYQNGT